MILRGHVNLPAALITSLLLYIPSTQTLAGGTCWKVPAGTWLLEDPGDTNHPADECSVGVAAAIHIGGSNMQALTAAEATSQCTSYDDSPVTDPVACYEWSGVPTDDGTVPLVYISTGNDSQGCDTPRPSCMVNEAGYCTPSQQGCNN